MRVRAYAIALVDRALRGARKGCGSRGCQFLLVHGFFANVCSMRCTRSDYNSNRVSMHQMNKI